MPPAATNGKSAKFFCENCGAEVPQNARVCRKCGRFFSAVRCPACGKTGTPDQFTDGCPACGYAVGKSGGNKNVSRDYYDDEKPRLTRNKKKNIKKAFAEYERKNPKRRGDERLPFWVYFVALVIFFGVLGFLFSKMS